MLKLLTRAKTYDITCVVNGHRESHLLNPTLRSVRRAVEAATKPGLKIEVLIALDNPDSDTRDIASQHLQSHWRILDLDFRDLALSRNAAVQQAKGRYVAFVDGDDMWCQTWLLDSYMTAQSRDDDVVLHPEFNVYFGANPHVLKHVDMESEEFDLDFLQRRNYWTALSFAARSLYERYPYQKNTILDGFGYEDWTWNFETIQAGVVHKIVRNNAHFIRRGKATASLLDLTNTNKAIPRILSIYRQQDVAESRSALA